jgi:uncharacterized zinc-type alcohol dehydrogenase-like protein
MNSYKFQKYQEKISSYHDQNNIPEIYHQKLAYYATGGSVSVPKLSKPKAIEICDLSIYELNKNKISGCGYGLLKLNSKLEPVSVERRLPYDSDVVIQILYCGVCHSDWHYIKNEWSSKLPLIPGHEITGIIIQLGKSVKKFKLSDPVGVGPYVNSCGKCDRCSEKNQQHCENGVSSTYDSQDRTPGSIKPNAEKTYGGFSNIITVNEKFVFKIPLNLPLDACSPLLCAGITTFSPLINFGVKSGMKVGVAGIGGLGHMAIKFAKKMGADVLAITRTTWKLKDSKRIGADKSVLSHDMSLYNNTLDFIIDTIPKIHNINPYIDLLKFKGTMCVVGVFDKMEIEMGNVISDKKIVTGSLIGGTNEIEQMLKFCSDHNIVSDIETINIKNINSTYGHLIKSDVKYRFVIEM